MQGRMIKAPLGTVNLTFLRSLQHLIGHKCSMKTIYIPRMDIMQKCMTRQLISSSSNSLVQVRDVLSSQPSAQHCAWHTSQMHQHF